MNTQKTATSYNWTRFVLAGLLTAITILTGLATAAPPENMPVWRAQIVVQMADVANAGSDDSVSLSLAGDNWTGLDSGEDDFERDRRYVYELSTTSIARLQDIEYLRISKAGSNGIALKAILLYINGQKIFEREFPGAAYWLENGGGWSNTLTIASYELRNNNAWLGFAQSSPDTVLSQLEIERRVEGAIGSELTFGQSSFLDWGKKEGGRYVEVSRLDYNTIRVDLDMEKGGKAVDVDFKMDVSFVNDRIRLTTYGIYATNLSNEDQERLVNFIDHLFESRLNIALSRAVYTDRHPYYFTGVNVNNTGGIAVTYYVIGSLLKSVASTKDGGEVAKPSLDDEDEVASQFKLRVETPDQIELNKENQFTVKAKSTVETAATVSLQMVLPVGVSYGGSIEIIDSNGARILNPEQTTTANGQTTLRWQDTLQLGQEVAYLVRLHFSEANNSSLKTTATLSMLNETADLIDGFEAETTFTTIDGTFRPQSTLQRALKAKN